MGTEKFFDETTPQSIVKAEIVEKYFDAWAGIMCVDPQELAAKVSKGWSREADAELTPYRGA